MEGAGVLPRPSAAIAAFGRECTRRGVPPPTVTLFGSQFLTWRGLPIFPSNKIGVEGGKTNILLMRIGESRQGVIGLYQPGLPGEQGMGLSVRFMGISRKAIASYLISLYCSLVIMTEDALGVLDNVEIGKYHDYKMTTGSKPDAAGVTGITLTPGHAAETPGLPDVATLTRLANAFFTALPARRTSPQRLVRDSIRSGGIAGCARGPRFAACPGGSRRAERAQPAKPRHTARAGGCGSRLLRSSGRRAQHPAHGARAESRAAGSGARTRNYSAGKRYRPRPAIGGESVGTAGRAAGFDAAGNPRRGGRRPACGRGDTARIGLRAAG